MNLEKEKNFISAVVYVHDDAGVIEKFLQALYDQLDENFLRFEIICVNDASTDGSVALLKRKAAALPKGVISIINMSFFQGVELAMNAGADLSIGDFVFEFDKTSALPALASMMQVYRTALGGYDIVSAVARGSAALDAKVFYNVFNAYSNKNYSLHSESFHLISRRALNRCQSLSKTIPYRKAVYADCGLKIASVELDCRLPAETQNEGKRLDTAVDALILFTSAATKMNLYIIGLFMLACVAVVLYVAFIYFGGHPVSGWTTTMLFLSFGFLSIFVVLGIMMKYLSVIIGLVFRNKTYVTESIEKLSK